MLVFLETSMSPSVALALRDLEKDPAPADDLRVSCANCDPDNPRSVPRKSCKHCGGTGRARTVLSQIASEIHTSRLDLLKGGKRRYSDDF